MRIALWTWMTPLLAAGCIESRPTADREPGADEPPPADQSPPESPPATRQPLFVAHEWGTFTSVQSSRGELQEGLHHEEAALPEFVYGRNPLSRARHKRMESLPEGVTQKMETPVIYFYSETARPVSVEVGFPQGVLSEWYPNAASYAPEVGALAGIRDGVMRWDVKLDPALAPAAFPPVSAEDLWAPSRRVASTPLTVGAEAEGFIFYRGLGRFELPMRVFADAAGTMQIANDSTEVIPAALLLHVHAGGGAVSRIGALGPGETRALPGTPKERDLDLYVADVAEQVHGALVASGLFADEARAMVDTWSASWFRTPGLRVLYVVPRAWTDALLPLRIQPVPDALVRTLVGRVEVLTPEVEAEVVAHVREAAAGRRPFDVEALGRFAEPKLRRAAELVDDPTVEAFLRERIAEAAQAP